MNTTEINALILLIQQLEPTAVTLVKELINKLVGMSESDIAALAHKLNQTAISDINAELSK